MSYNVQGFNGPGIVHDPESKNLAKIIEYLKQQTPEILCLQECTGDWRGYVKRLDSLYAHFDTVVVFRSKNVINAVGIFTPHRILKQERIFYPSQGNGSVAWVLKRGADTLLVVNNHFETNHLNKSVRQQYRNILHGEETADSMREQTKNIMGILGEQAVVRAPQARAVARYIDSVCYIHRDWLVIVCGDFNESPISYTHYTIADKLTDCYEEAGCGPGWSMQAKAFPVRIDNILCNRRLKPLDCKVDRSLAASDHYPIRATLEIQR
jgi:endonuclease/exonuclease/phosphatase family metal-dependent hydrolase